MHDTNTKPGGNEPTDDGDTPSGRPPADAPETRVEGQVDVMPSVDDLLREAELKVAEHHDAWLRAKAETENLRRRAQEDVAKAHKFAVEKFAQAMLPIKDSLEATLLAESATLESLKAGVELTLKQLSSAFTSAHITETNPVGEKFDPHLHQAISTVESDGEANRVVTVLQKGYVLHERVLRPALVVVSKARGGGASA